MFSIQLVIKRICDAQGYNDRAEYGIGLLKYISERLTDEFGKGFEEVKARLFYMPSAEELKLEIEKQI